MEGLVSVESARLLDVFGWTDGDGTEETGCQATDTLFVKTVARNKQTTVLIRPRARILQFYNSNTVVCCNGRHVFTDASRPRSPRCFWRHVVFNCGNSRMHSTKRGAGDGFHDALVSIIEMIIALVQWNDDPPKKWTRKSIHQRFETELPPRRARWPEKITKRPIHVHHAFESYFLGTSF